jgi:hypothetical protein
MAVVTQTTKNPAISPNAATIAGPIDPGEFRGAVNTYVAAVEDKAQQSVAFVEQLQQAIGNGALSGGTISAGAGLSVSIAAFKALIGTVIETDAATIVGGLTPSDLNYIYARQDGTFTVNLDDSDPTDIAAHGDFLRWGTATTDGSGVTGVTNDRDTFAGGLFSATTQTYTATNVTTDRSYDANSTTLDEVADVLGTLISDLRAKGIVL